MGELHWETHHKQHHLKEGAALKAKVWHSTMYGWCLYCWTKPPAQMSLQTGTLTEAQALAVALVKLN